MLRQPLIQTAVFDVADWEPDSEFGVFPQGARAKDAVFAPTHPPEPVIVPGKRYLFKRSKRSYPDQFWAEIVAYRVGCLMDVGVTPTFAAWNSRTKQCAALIEWFYDDSMESFVMAGDFLQQLHKDYDRKLGTQHNILDNMRLLRMLTIPKVLAEPHWRQWWIDALLFDALIGNTDRHQDNWGFIFIRSQQNISCRLAPLFDNGTSLGHERFTNHVSRWTDVDYQRYISKGKHHVKWSLKDPVQGHIALLQRALEQWPDTREAAHAKLNFSSDDLSDAVVDLPKLNAVTPLSNERHEIHVALNELPTHFIESFISMNILRHIAEPTRLLMTWQPLDETASSRTRRVIGEIRREKEGQIVFRYLQHTSDFDEARKAGFKGFPAFHLKDKDDNEVRQGVIESLMRRLPPRKREDFDDFLAQHRLPSPFNNSDMALLGYTGARLPSDGFALVPDFSASEVPCDYLMEVAGLRHIFGTDISSIHVGDPVEFVVDHDNPVDQDALLVICQGQKIGYVNRAFRETLHRWLKQYHVSAAIEKLNGKPERPLVYVRISAN